MADHGAVEFATAEGNDLPAHEATYERFVHLTFVLISLIVCILLGLTIGGVLDHWLTAALIFIAAPIVAFHGLVSGARVPSAIMVLLSLLALAFSAWG